MNVADELTRSIWMDIRAADAPSLDRNGKADVAIVGSGIAGLSAAYELATRGCSVIVLDRGRIGSGMTARTTAHLASALDDFYAELIKGRSADIARVLYQSVATSIDRAEAIQAEEEIDCDFKRLDGYLFLAPTTPASQLDEEFEACKKLGVSVEDCREQLPLHAKNLVRSLRFPKQGRFHPLKYLLGLADAIQRRGGQLYGDTCVTLIEQQKGEVRVKTAAGHEVSATDVFVATNSPINDRTAIHTKQAPYRTYVIAATLPHGTLDDALYWDTLDPYHYVRLQPFSDQEDIVIVGGEDHKSGQADDSNRRFAMLEHWARDRLPEMRKVTHRWSGQIMEPLDYVGFVGKNPHDDHVYVATGDSGQGITNGLVAGMLVADLITLGKSPWSEVYDPARKIVRNIGEFVSENITPIRNFAEYLTAGDIDALERLKPGEGGLFRSGLKKLAACRDLSGALHVKSASCTHLGCVVHWNSLEQCWDCACHGSQFAPDGTALNGPAVSPLAEAHEASAEAAE
jgi:glycine/D-amino acid oxidase-like deaminating enzyme/nitrite reductase/ring-hydroxylating ferredoxin subunit